jgi:hypothetical protein
MFLFKPIGFVESPYKESSEIPKGLGVKHEAEGVLKVLPEFEPGLLDVEGFSHLFVIGRSIAPPASTSPPVLHPIIGRTGSLPPALLAAPTRSGLPWCSFLAAIMSDFRCGELTCWMARRS